MIEFETSIDTTDGEMECFISHPEGSGPFPAVIVYMDVLGIREELRNITRRLAEQGYYSLLPDMFYRAGRIRFDPATDGIEKVFAIGKTLTIDKIMSDTEAMLNYLDKHNLVTGPTGGIGYCMSGQFVVAAAGHFPDHFRAAASLHGVSLVTTQDDSPHKLADRINAEIYLGFASDDPYVEDNVISDLSEALENNGVTFAVETHPDTEHAYSFPERPTYDMTAAEKDWTAMLEMFERTLKN